jgi:PKD domain-containing protein
VKLIGTLFRHVTVATAFMVSACTTSQIAVPGVTGPSELALSLRVTATPDSISQDGSSQSAIVVNAFDANGRPLAGVSLRMDMVVGGSVQDFGTLSARTIVTGSDGSARTVYTAPPPPPAAAGGAGTVVTIVAVPTGSNHETANPQLATIRLVPPGVIVPPAGTPIAAFTFSPTPVIFNNPTIFDASTSQPGSGATSITSYSWDFGDFGTAAGPTVTHTFRTAASFNVTLTVTNNRGVSASVTQAVTAVPPALPTAAFVYSPQPVTVGATVSFNADVSTAAPGHSIQQWNWDFGDPGSPNNSASGSHVSHQFSGLVPQKYEVVLTVVDDAGQRNTIQTEIDVK